MEGTLERVFRNETACDFNNLFEAGKGHPASKSLAPEQTAIFDFDVKKARGKREIEKQHECQRSKRPPQLHRRVTPED